MNNKCLYKKIGMIDHDLIEEAADMTSFRLRNRQRTKWMSIVASIFLVISAGVASTFLYKVNIKNQVSKNINNNSLVVEKNDHENLTKDNSDIKGFAITAYTAANNSKAYLTANYKKETTATVMRPNVKILLARYNLFISSVPGLPFTFDITDKNMNADVIKVSVNSGSLLTWDSQIENALVNDCGSEYICHIGDTLYWSPLNEEENSIVSNATITVSAMIGEEAIGHQTINITYDGENYHAIIGDFEGNSL